MDKQLVKNIGTHEQVVIRISTNDPFEEMSAQLHGKTLFAGRCTDKTSNMTPSQKVLKLEKG